MRKFVLWLTGRDLFAPSPPSHPAVKIRGWDQNWEYTACPDWFLVFTTPAAPNVLHRIAQRVMLGIRWRMK